MAQPLVAILVALLKNGYCRAGKSTEDAAKMIGGWITFPMREV